MASSGKLWSLYGLFTTLGAAALAKKAVNKTWQLGSGKEPPRNLADPDVQAREALLWAVLTGVAAGVAKVLVSRKSAGYYLRSTGKKPPELDTMSTGA